MTTFLLMLIPPGAVVVYAAWRYLTGRPLRRHDLNVLYALLLLGYFFSTAGLGIFWVANQDLPVFDLHYLFGYLTLALVLVHLGFNGKAILAFLRRRAPSVLLTPEGRSWRPAARMAGRVLGWTLFGAICFWMGLRQGASRVEVVRRAPPEPRPLPGAMEDGGGEGALQERARPVPRQMVIADGEEVPLAFYYHEKTKHSRVGVIGESAGLDWSRQPSVFKEYPEARKIPLPREFLENGISTGDAIDACRRPVTSFTPGEISLLELSTLLHLANGITATRRFPGRTYHFRSAASAGALYPTVTYLLVNRVEGIDPGLYHYGVKDHELRLLRTGSDLAPELAKVTASGHLMRDASAVFLFSSIFFRSSWKYGERAYRYCLLDAGHVAENLMLAAAALEMASLPVGRFDDREVNRFLGVDDREEGSLLLVPVGRAGEGPPPWEEAVFAARPREIRGDGDPLLLLAHGETYLGLQAGGLAGRVPPGEPKDKPYGESRIVPLPDEFPTEAPLFPSIQERRSVRKWFPVGMMVEELSSVLYHSFGIRDRKGDGMPDPSVESNHLLRLYLIVNGVEGLDPGVYSYRRHDHALSLIREGNHRQRTYAISIFQEVVGDSGVALVMTIDANSLGTSDGDRGYRYACLDGGMLGERLYLQAGALGLGYCAIGAFFDDEVSEVIGVDPRDEWIICMGAMGVKSPK